MNQKIPNYLIVAIMGLLFITVGLATILANESAEATAEPEVTLDPAALASPTPTETPILAEATEAVLPPVQSDPVVVQPDPALVVVQPVDPAIVVEPSPDPNSVPPVEIIPTLADPNPVAPIPTAMDTVPITDPNGDPPATQEVLPELPEGVVPIPTAIDAPPLADPNAPVPGRTDGEIPVGGGGAGGAVPIVEGVIAAPLPTSAAPVEPITQPTAISPVVEPTAIDVSAPVTSPVIVPTAQTPVDSVIIPPTLEVAAPAVQSVPGQVSGIITFPMAADHTGISVVLTLPDGSTLQNLTTAAGEFVFPNLQPGAYYVEARHDGFLARSLDFTLTEGQAFNLPASFLVAGDTDLNEIVDLSDAALIALNFDGPATVVVADLNRDGWIDVRDLALVGADFGLSGPIPWQ